MTSTNDATGMGRRDLFRVGAGAAAAAAASATASTAAAQEEFDYGDWFDDVPNFEETADRTGEDEVEVTVGPDGEFTFEPPAIHVDPGTTVVWEWDEGFHDVVEQESGERYASDTVDESGTTYSVTFDGEGISTYVCTPHVDQGMKGAVAVGSGEGDLEIEEGEMEAGGADEADEADADDAAQDEGDAGEEDQPSAEQAGDDTLALFGIAGVLALLSPIGLVLLMYRNAKQEADEF